MNNKATIGDVSIHKGMPDKGNPYRGRGFGMGEETIIEGNERIEALRTFRETGKVGKYTFWYAPWVGGARQIKDRDEIDWGGTS